MSSGPHLIIASLIVLVFLVGAVYAHSLKIRGRRVLRKITELDPQRSPEFSGNQVLIRLVGYDPLALKRIIRSGDDLGDPKLGAEMRKLRSLRWPVWVFFGFLSFVTLALVVLTVIHNS